MVQLPVLPGTAGGRAFDINNFTQIAGECDNRACLWDTTHEVIDLNTALSPADQEEWTLATATDINDHGQIVGSGFHNGEVHAYLLTPTKPAEPAPEIRIDRILMNGSDTLQIDVFVEFGDRADTEKSIEITTVINQTTLSGSTHPSCIVMLPPGTVGELFHSFRIPLDGAGVPRFTSNQFFNVTAVARDGIVEGMSQKSSAILLPVIVVPGILSKGGGDGTFPQLESMLISKSSTAFGPDGAYAMLGTSSYPNLVTLAYDSDLESFDGGALILSLLIDDVTRMTYAAKVNLVAHSKGGLVGRAFVTTFPEMVSQLIMCAPPNLGSIWAWFADQPVTHGIVRGIDHLPGVELLVDLPERYDYSNLYPTWPWFRVRPRMPFVEIRRNRDLHSLNERTLSRNVQYTIVCSKSEVTATTYTVFPLLPTMIFGVSEGDSIVSFSSAIGNMSQTTIPAFQELISAGKLDIVEKDGKHKGYLEQDTVVDEVFRRLIR